MGLPGNIETDKQPPMTVPLRHFLVGIGLLLTGAVVGIAIALDAAPAWARITHVHLLLVGWVCVTIMGAMTQFVPVWSGVELHSRRLAVAQLWLVTVGLVGFGTAFLLGTFRWLVPFGTLLLVGFWTFVYNVGRTLAAVDRPDVTERHFAIALLFFLLLTAFGLVLAVDLSWSVLPVWTVTRGELVGAHATLAVFGAVLVTVFGALYQLATMFTQSDLHGVDLHLQRLEAVAYPLGVVLLTGGRLLSVPAVATVGGIATVAGVLGMSVVLARRLYETQVELTPMLRRYALVVPAMVLWALLTLPAWIHEPLSPGARFGAPGTVHLVTFGIVGFVVLGTLYHVVPFVVWVHRYSDLLGFRDVPMIDDLYDDRIARADLVATATGAGLLFAGDRFELAPSVEAVGGVLATLGFALFASNVVLLLRRHSPHTLPGTLFDTFASDDHADGEAIPGDGTTGPEDPHDV